MKIPAYMGFASLRALVDASPALAPDEKGRVLSLAAQDPALARRAFEALAACEGALDGVRDGYLRETCGLAGEYVRAGALAIRAEGVAQDQGRAAALRRADREARDAEAREARGALESL